jgi:hypothetical protein
LKLTPDINCVENNADQSVANLFSPPLPAIRRNLICTEISAAGPKLFSLPELYFPVGELPELERKYSPMTKTLFSTTGY